MAFFNKATRYLINNIKQIIFFSVLGAFVGVVVLPRVAETKHVLSAIRTILSAQFSMNHIVVFLLILSAIILVSKPLALMLKRYLNNWHHLDNVPFTVIDGILFFVVFFMVSSFRYADYSFVNIDITEASAFYLICSFVLFMTFVLIQKALSEKAVGLLLKCKFQSSVYPDCPIDNESEDILGRADFVSSMYEQICKFPYEHSNVIGLYSHWGEGKTSVLNLLERKLASNENITIYSFDPWHYSTTEALMKGFFNGFHKAINKKYFHPNMIKLVNRYHKTIASGLKTTDLPLVFPAIEDSIESQKDEIQKLIKSFGRDKRFVIFIDDIDRLHDKNDLFQILKLVKLLANFDQITFLLAFDPSIVQSVLKKNFEGDINFLDKIIQQPIHLPKAEQGKIDDFLLYSYPKKDYVSGINRLLSSLDIERSRVDTFTADFDLVYRAKARSFFPTIRHAIRYLNGLASSLPAIFKEVNLTDFFILEIIRIFHSDVYADIWKNPSHYITVPLEPHDAIVRPLGIPSTHENEQETDIKHINHATENNNNVIGLISEIFPNVCEAYKQHPFLDSNRSRINQRISDHRVFPRYFLGLVPLNDIPDEWVVSLISKWDSVDETIFGKTFLNDVKIMNRYDCSATLDILKDYSGKLNIRTSKSLAFAISNNINEFSRVDVDAIRGSEFTMALKWLYELLTPTIKDNVGSAEYNELIRVILSETPSLFLAVKIVRDNKGKYGILVSEDAIEPMSELVLERLRKTYIDENKDAFAIEPSFMFIFHWWANFNMKHKEVAGSYIFDLLASNSKYVGKFIKGYTGPMSDVVNYTELSSAIDVAHLYELINQDELNKYYSELSEKEAIDNFIEQYKRIRQAQEN